MTIYKNKVTIVGNLGNDPEIKTSGKGNEFAVLSVATTEFYRDKENKSETKTEWHDIAIYTPHFVKLIKQYPKKGDIVYIEGSLTTNKWIDKTSGKEQSAVQIVVKSFGDDFQFESRSKEATEEPDNQ